jgi:hypothetical protein
MKKVLVFILGALVLISSCSKEENLETKKTDSVIKKTLTPEEVVLKDKLEAASQVVRDVVLKSPEVVKEVSDLINRKMYRDDYIPFKDLFEPQENVNLKSSEIQSTLFEKIFDEIINSKSNRGINQGMKEFLVAADIVLYSPYPIEDYPVENQLPTCTSDPIDNDIENLGYQLEDDGSYSLVTVDEEYSEDYPVWIVMEDETESDISIQIPEPTTTASSTIHQLRVGQVRSTKQYDGFFNGGSEFKFCLLGGTITLTNATSFTGLQTCFLTRTQIRKGKWVDFQYELDDDWFVSNDGSSDEGGRQFGLIEYDKNKMEYTLNFEPKVKIDKIEVSAGKVSVTIVSEEGWIKLDNYLSRSTFMQFNKTDMGHGLQDGYRVYAAGEVYWTLPLIEY